MCPPSSIPRKCEPTPSITNVPHRALLALTTICLVIAGCAGCGGHVAHAPGPSGVNLGASSTPAVLPDAPPPNSGCDGNVIAHTDVNHESLGAIRVFLLLKSSAEDYGHGCIATVTGSGKALPAIPIDAHEGTLRFPSPATDATGNTFVTYNPGRYDGVLVLIPTAAGFEDIGWDDQRYGTHYEGRRAYYYAELVGPGADGKYTIRQSHNDCTPDCADSTITTQDLHWNGSDYVL